MIKQSIIRAFLLGAVLVPAVNRAMEQESNFTYPIQQNRFERYAPIGVGLGVIGWQLCSGGPLTSCGFNTLGQTITEHPFKAAGVLSSTVVGLWALQQSRYRHQKQDPSIREQRDDRGLLYSAPFWASMAINTFLTSPLAPSLATPLFVASACSMAAAGLSANIIDSIKDNLEIKHVKETNNLANAIIHETGRQNLGFTHNKSAKGIKNQVNNLITKFEQVDISKRETWYSQDTQDLCNKIQSRVIFIGEDE